MLEERSALSPQHIFEDNRRPYSHTAITNCEQHWSELAASSKEQGARSKQQA